MPPEQDEGQNTPLSTEDEILNSMGDLDDDQGEETTNTDEGTSEATPAPKEDEGKGQVNTDDKKGGEGSNKVEGKQSTGGPQDLLDKDGNVLAKGGAERRLYERAQKLDAEVRTAREQNERLTTELEAYKKSATLGNEFGLTPQELTTGAQIIASFKQDPVATIKSLLTQVQSMGHDIEEIGASGVSMDAIKRMINEAVSPLTSKAQEEQETNSRREQAAKVYRDFATKYPDVEVHTESIVNMMRNDPSLTLEAAYHKLRSEYALRGLDWTKPVSQLQKEAEEARKQPSNKQPDMPSGGNTNRRAVVETSEAVSPETSFDEIIRASMKEAGY